MDIAEILKATIEGPILFRLFSGILVVAFLSWLVWGHIISTLPNLYFKKVDVYYIEKDPGQYQVGLLLEIVNKDVNKICIVTGAEYKGGFRLVGGGATIMQSIGFYKADSKVTGKYSLTPGSPIPIKLEVPQIMSMSILGGQGPILEFVGVWTLLLEKKAIAVMPQEGFNFRGVISNVDWSNLQG